MEQLGEEIWAVPLPFSVLGCRLGTRTTILRRDEELLLISPGPLDWDSISKLGKVTALVAPNKMHHLFLSEALVRFPDACLYLPPGLAEKRPDLPLATPLPADLARWGLQNNLMPGVPQLNEVVFFHPASGTLVLTDLAFNFGCHPHRSTRWMLRLNGAHNRFGPSKVLKHIIIRDRTALREALIRVLEWPIQQIVVGHGEVLRNNAKKTLTEAFGWLLADSLEGNDCR